MGGDVSQRNRVGPFAADFDLCLFDRSRSTVFRAYLYLHTAVIPVGGCAFYSKPRGNVAGLIWFFFAWCECEFISCLVDGDKEMAGNV